MSIESFIAKRYLISKHKINFISIISLISVTGITIGVAALIVVLSVFNGFGSLVTSFLVNFDPHVRVDVINRDAGINYKQFEKELAATADVKNVSPYVSGKIVAYRANLYEVVNLKGIEESAGVNTYDIKKNILFGKYDIEETGLPRVVLGLRLADRLQTLIGDTLTLISPAGIENVIAQYSLPQMQQYIVAGIYSSNNNEYDASYMFTSLSSAQNIFKMQGRVHGYDLRLNSLNNSGSVKESLERKLNKKDFKISTWFDFHKELYTVMQIERWAAYIILSLIIAVATFNILGSLSMSVVEKKRDIGILRSMGITEKSIVKIFMFEGLLIGIIGTVAGALLGYFICFLQIQYKIYPLDPTKYKIDALPLDVRITDLFFIAGMSLLLSYIASLFPAKKAAKTNPLEAINWE